MRLSVRHETRYRYSRPVAFGRHRLVLRPREAHDLTLLRHRLVIEPRHAVTWIRDVHDNVIALVDFEDSGNELVFLNEFEVRRVPPFPREQPHDLARAAWPVDYDDTEMPLVEAYRRPSFPDDADAVRGWAAGTPAQEARDAEAVVMTLCEAVHGAVTYRRRSEKGVQNPVRTLKEGNGSCRDLSVLLMEAARSYGLAARFASGYLHGTASMAGRASTHAWVEIYLPALGWRGVDPTLGSPTDLRHVAVGVSHHPRGVMPVSGSYIGSGSDLLGHTVSVQTEELEDERSVSARRVASPTA